MKRHEQDFEAQAEDGRLTEPSNFNYDFDVRKAIELSKQKGRPLTEDEIDALRRSK